MARKGEPLFAIFNWQRALLYSNLPKETKTVGWALSTFTNKHGGNAHPGEENLADLLSMTARTVRTHLARLRADGYIRRVVRGSVAEKRNWADVYELTFPEETTGSELPEVAWDDHRTPVSGDEGSANPPETLARDSDHRKSGGRPPEIERTDHRKLVSAQQRSSSTHNNKASASPDAARRASAPGDSDPLRYDDPWTGNEDRIAIVTKALGGHLEAGDEQAISGMIERQERFDYIVNVIRNNQWDPAA